MTPLVLPWPSKDLSPNGRVHWAKKAKAARSEKHQAFLLTRAAGWHLAKLPESRIHLWIDFYPPTARMPDDDNMLARFKAARDGIAQALGIDDQRFISHPNVRGEKRAGGQVVVTLTGGIGDDHQS